MAQTTECGGIGLRCGGGGFVDDLHQVDAVVERCSDAGIDTHLMVAGDSLSIVEVC